MEPIRLSANASKSAEKTGGQEASYQGEGLFFLGLPPLLALDVLEEREPPRSAWMIGWRSLPWSSTSSSRISSQEGHSRHRSGGTPPNSNSALEQTAVPHAVVKISSTSSSSTVGVWWWAKPSPRMTLQHSLVSFTKFCTSSSTVKFLRERLWPSERRGPHSTLDNFSPQCSQTKMIPAKS